MPTVQNFIIRWSNNPSTYINIRKYNRLNIQKDKQGSNGSERLGKVILAVRIPKDFRKEVVCWLSFGGWGHRIFLTRHTICEKAECMGGSERQTIPFNGSLEEIWEKNPEGRLGSDLDSRAHQGQQCSKSLDQEAGKAVEPHLAAVCHLPDGTYKSNIVREQL
jgi:hypothetical protein